MSTFHLLDIEPGIQRSMVYVYLSRAILPAIASGATHIRVKLRGVQVVIETNLPEDTAVFMRPWDITLQRCFSKAPECTDKILGAPEKEIGSKLSPKLKLSQLGVLLIRIIKRFWEHGRLDFDIILSDDRTSFVAGSGWPKKPRDRSTELWYPAQGSTKICSICPIRESCGKSTAAKTFISCPHWRAKCVVHTDKNDYDALAWI